MTLAASLKHNLANLHRFRGRDRQGLFWPYAILVFFAVLIGLAVVTGLWVAEQIAQIQRIAAELRETGQVSTGSGQYAIKIENGSPVPYADMSDMAIGIAIVFFLAAALLAAAVTRRLHDRGRSGLWGLLPIPFFLVATAMMSRGMGQPEHGPLSTLLFLNNAAYVAALAILFLLLLGASTPGPNRYGDPHTSRL